MGHAERHFGRQQRSASLAPRVFKRCVYKSKVPAVTLLKLTIIAILPSGEQPEQIFD